MSDDQKTWVLLFQCLDQRGIVAKISDFLFQLQGNIVTADQYATERQGGHFFIRIEFVVSASWTKQSLSQAFAPVAAHFNAQWDFYDKQAPLRMGIFVSQPDHCLFELLYLWRSGELRVEIPFVISNHEPHRQLVQQFGLPFHFVPATKQDRKEQELLSLARDTSDFLVLARYMLTLSGDFLQGYARDIINIHHSFLPSFKGARPYQQAYDKGVKVIGATAHFVVERLDEGPIISQETARVTHRDDVESLKRKGKNLEQHALSSAVLNYIDYRIIRYQNKTIVFEDK